MSVGDLNGVDTSCREASRELARCRCQPVLGDCDDLDGQPRRVRLGDEMLALEEHLIAAVAQACHVAEAGDERVLTAGEATHSR